MGSREYIVGSGDGSVTLVRDLLPKISLDNKENNKSRRKSSNVMTSMVGEPTKSSLREVKRGKFEGSVTSICKLDGGSALLVGTSSGDAHQMDLLTFNSNLLSTCHGGSINDLAFPQGLDGILGTCAQDGIRLWSLAHGQQLLHIRQQGALCLTFYPDGSCILCGFEDGCIRSYTPESGRLIGCTQGAHPQGGVSAMTLVGGGRYLLSGGVSGHVRSWEFNRRSGNLRLLATVREHKGQVRSMQVTQDQKEFLSGSADGFCIIWDATE